MKWWCDIETKMTKTFSAHVRHKVCCMAIRIKNTSYCLQLLYLYQLFILPQSLHALIIKQTWNKLWYSLKTRPHFSITLNHRGAIFADPPDKPQRWKLDICRYIPPSTSTFPFSTVLISNTFWDFNVCMYV